MSKIVFDIETVGEDFDAMDQTSKDMLLRWADDEEAEQEVKDGLGFSPLTGQIVAIGVMDADTSEGAVYFQDPTHTGPSFAEATEGSASSSIKLKIASEKEMLEKFWDIAKRCDECISFNGRAFDVPFILVRSAIHKIRPTINLMPPRYNSNACHIDLLDQLTFYGSVRKKGNLHMWSRAFGIKSPKADGINGDDVGKLFRDREFLKIAEYNVGDLKATAELYKYWNAFIRF